MDSYDIARLRLENQLISRHQFKDPEEVVSWMCAMQGQDFNAVKWAVAQRTGKDSEKAVDAAIASGTIVRSWPMRRTLHFMAADDASWMLELLAHKAARASSLSHHRVGLTHKDIDRARQAIAAELKGGRHVTREGMYEVMRRIGINTDSYRGMHILAHLAFERFIIFGRPEGKQQTFALFNEWIKNSRKLTDEQAKHELVRRYFVSHGPATVHDLNWWSGLNIGDIKKVLQELDGEFERGIVEGRTYYWKSTRTRAMPVQAYLLPPFDEYIVSYRHRADVLHDIHRKNVISVNGIFSPVLVIDGQVAGVWSRTVKTKGVSVGFKLFRSLKREEKSLVDEAAERYAGYLKMPLLSVE